jgi:hypothetical protein
MTDEHYELRKELDGIDRRYKKAIYQIATGSVVVLEGFFLASGVMMVKDSINIRDSIPQKVYELQTTNSNRASELEIIIKKDLARSSKLTITGSVLGTSGLLLGGYFLLLCVSYSHRKENQK